MAPTGATKDERMNSFIKCVTALLREFLYVDDTAMIATLSVTGNKSLYITSKGDLPTNFTNLGSML